MIRSTPFTISVETRLSTYYGLFFLAIGSFTPFSAVWFDSLNISSTMTGAIFAAPAITTVVFAVFIGRWADRLADWRSAIIICNWLVLISASWILVRQEPWDLLFIWTVAGLFTRAAVPIVDAAALNSTQKNGTDYGRIRSFGSMGFIAGVLLAGLIFDHFGIQWFVAVLLLSAIARVMGAHMLPKFKANSALNSTVILPGSGIIALLHPGILLVLLGSALINASHGFNNVFSIMHWTKIGFSTTVASVFWTVSVLAEVALMWRFKSIAKMFSARKCLLLASVVSTVRWFIAGTDPTFTQLLFLQALHSITFGLTFLATVNFISKRVHENHAAQAQSVYAMLTTLFLGLSGWISGWLYMRFAGHSYWAMSVLALAGGVVIAWSFRCDFDEKSTA